MAVEAASLSSSLQSGIQGLKRAADQDKVAVSLSSAAVQQGASAQLSSPTPAEGSGTVVDIYA